MEVSKDAGKTKALITLGFLLLIAFELIINNAIGEFTFFSPNNNTFSMVLLNKILSHPLTAFPIVHFILIQSLIHLGFIIYNYYYYNYLYYIKNLINHYGINHLINKAIINPHVNSFSTQSSTKYRLIFYYLSFFSFVAMNYLFILTINNEYYPNSKFSFANIFSSNNFINIINHRYFYIIALIALYFGVVCNGLCFFTKYVKSKKNLLLILIIILLIILDNTFKLLPTLSYSKHRSITNKPNVILFTMDSTRADFINNIAPIDNKYLDLSKFMSDSVKFNNAYTPLARSFPALYSLLSGNYPKTDNIRFNLVDQTKINYANLLPNLLKTNGYETFYATDSSQFHIINKKWGYNVLAAPKSGIYEQIFPVINDLPLSNLIINFAISEYLFPYDYSNASAHNTYNPETYVNRVINKLQTLDNKKPLFLHFNFEVAHWPYLNRNIDKNLSVQERYTLCLNVLNSQINRVFKYLTDQNILSNSIVVMTSDHGESLNITNDKLTNYNNYVGPTEYLSYINKSPVDYTFAELTNLNITNSNILSTLLNINTSGGHGVDVLSNSQYKTLTALQRFQSTSIYPKQEINNLVLLNDLYPTILDLLNINHQKSADHLSLVKLFDYKFADDLNQHYQTEFINRDIFLETELQVPYYKPQELANKDIITSFINTWGEYYHINKSQYLELKATAVTKLLRTKQYAVVNNNNVLAYIPNGLKSDWEIITNDQLQKPSCIVPRVIKDANNNILGTLCNNYKESNGYYVYYNAQQNNWQIFPNSDLFQNKPDIYKLYTSLKANYQNEILPLG